MQKNNGVCLFLGVKESFLPDLLKFSWDYLKLKFSQNKDKLLCDQLQCQPLVPIKKTAPTMFCENLNIQESCKKISATPKNWQPPSFCLKCIFVACMNWPILDSYDAEKFTKQKLVRFTFTHPLLLSPWIINMGTMIQQHSKAKT